MTNYQQLAYHRTKWMTNNKAIKQSGLTPELRFEQLNLLITINYYKQLSMLEYLNAQ